MGRGRATVRREGRIRVEKGRDSNGAGQITG